MDAPNSPSPLTPHPRPMQPHPCGIKFPISPRLGCADVLRAAVVYWTSPAMRAKGAEKMERKSFYRVLALAMALLGLIPAGALASELAFTHAGVGSGTLNGVPFPASAFVITAYGDTNSRILKDVDVWSINHTSASISIVDLGTIDLLTGTRTFVNHTSIIVGFSRVSDGTDLFNGPMNSAFSTWDMLGPIGPFSGTGNLLQWSLIPQINTNRGILLFNNSSSPATFSATMVPEPTTLVLLAFGSFVMIGRRNRPTDRNR